MSSKPPERRLGHANGNAAAKHRLGEVSPEEILAQALEQDGHKMNSAEVRLILSGYKALRAHRERPVNENERNAILGMIAYVAETQNVREDRVHAVLAATYNVDKIDQIPSRLYQNAIEFLLEIEMFKIVN